MEDWQRDEEAGCRRVCEKAGYPFGLDELIGKEFIFVPTDSGYTVKSLREHGFLVPDLVRGVIVAHDMGDTGWPVNAAEIQLTVELSESYPLAVLIPQLRFSVQYGGWSIVLYDCHSRPYPGPFDGKLIVIEP